MNKVIFQNKYPTNLNIYTTIPVEVYIDEFTTTPIPPGTMRIVMLEEPMRGSLYKLARDHPQYYDRILTYQDEILENNPKAVLFRCADTWVYGYQPNKKLCVSTVVGGKDDARMGGYALRHELWRRQGEITVPKDFYLSGQYKWPEADYSHSKILGDSKTPMFDSMFHVAIENTSIKHYFSEKLLDCLHTRTVPIYCGCTNVENYFNIDGIIKVNNVDEIIAACNNISEDMYNKMLPAINDNFERVQSRVNYFQQLEAKLLELFKSLNILA